MLTKGLAFGCALLAVAAMYYRGQMYAAEVALTSMTSERDSLLENVVPALKDANERTSATLDFTLGMHSKQLEKTDGYVDELRASERKTAETLMELDRLRNTEHGDALAAPFERGNAARARLTDSVCRAWGLGPDDDPRCGGTRGDGDAGAEPGN